MRLKNLKRYAVLTEKFDHFFQSPLAGGVVLLCSTLTALALANIPATRDFYHMLLHTDFTVGFDRFHLTKSVEHWINDGLMVVFFFAVGLEIKREIMVGELCSVKKASLPIAAAIGGMIVPAVIYLFFNAGTTSESGWGIPMATDIAFALGILYLMGNKVPLSLKVFLTALAIVDDLGAIVVIALFYSSELNLTLLTVAIVVLLILITLNKSNVRRLRYYVVPAVIVWILFLNSGIHATIAGVLIAFTIPSTAMIGKNDFARMFKQKLSLFIKKDINNISLFANNDQHLALQQVRKVVRNSIPPSQRLEYELHNFVTFFVMPVFAFANAGVTIGASGFSTLPQAQSLGIIFGLVVGKPVGIFLLSWLTVKAGLGELPKGASWKLLFAVACFGGIGFTMSMFINNLAFDDPNLISSGKIAILTASFIAALAGFTVMNLVSKKKARDI